MKKIFLFILLFCGLHRAYSQVDAFTTSKGILEIKPVYHGSFWLKWNTLTIAVDPYGGAEQYADMGQADIILITDIHGDHLDSSTLVKLDLSKAIIIAPKAVQERLVKYLPGTQKIQVLANDEKIELSNISITGVPMYNLPDTPGVRHPKGRGNGYVLRLGGKRLYISGDTEDIPEMRKLEKIDIAFICMNKPYTMDIQQAAAAVLAFKPLVVYPFHYRQPTGFSDTEAFRKLVIQGNPDIDVRLRNWYLEKL